MLSLQRVAGESIRPLILSVSSSSSPSLQIVYDNSPREHYRNAGGERFREKQILGGEAAMWTEQVIRK